MKKLLQSLCWCVLIFLSSSDAFAQVQYKIEYNVTTQRYQVTMKPLANYSGAAANTGSAQVTIVVPTGGNFTPSNVQSQFGTWNLDNAIVRGPSENPNFDYISFYMPSPVTGVNYVANVEMPLFSFGASGNCIGSISLINNTTDPFYPSPVTGTNSQNINVGNQISIFGYQNNLLANAYQSNYGSAAACPNSLACAIQYEIVKNGNTFQVNMIPNVTYTGAGNITSTQQVTVKVPTGLVYTNLTSLTSGATYVQGSRVNAPSQSSSNDYIMFNLNNLGTSALTYTSGISVPLFKFDVPNGCNGTIGLMPNTDPFVANTSYNSKQQITVLGYGQPDAPICFVGSGVINCPSAPTNCLIEYQLERISATKFQVSMIPNVTYSSPNNLTSTQQVTIKVPTGFQYNNLTSLISGANYIQGSRINTPSQATSFDYILFNLQSLGTSALTYTNGNKLPLFTFDRSSACTGDSIRLMTNSDPFVANTAYNSKQQLTVLGYGQPDIPICIKGTGAVACAAIQSCLIKYQLETVNGCEYKVSMIPDTTWSSTNGGITKVAKVTLRVPHNCFTLSNLTSLAFGANFTVASIVTAPVDNPNYDYICLSMTTVPTVAIPYVKGQSVPLFTFKNGGNCCGNIELMPDTDPFAHGNSLNQNFDQHWATSGTGTSGVEPCIIGTSQPCIPANGASNILGNDVNICGGTSTNLSVTGSYASYEWSPTTGLSCSNCSNPIATPTTTTTYTVTVTTAAGCQLTDQITVTITPVASNVNVVATNSTSCTSGNGSITVNATGTGTFEYSINNGTTWQINNVFANLPAGSYTVVVRTQGSTCVVANPNNPVLINSASAPTISSVLSTNPTDCGLNDGTITITAIGVGSPFSYSINNGFSFQTSPIFSNLSAGNYKIVVKSVSTTCQTTAPDVILVAPPSPSISTATTTATSDCSLNDGSINITATGGQSPLEYSINGTTWQNSNIFTNLATGTYVINVRNADNSCVVNSSIPVVVQMPPMPSITNVVSSSPTACGTNNGTIAVSGTGGQGQLEYSVDGINWQTGGIFSNLSSGTYYVYIRNQDNSCPKTYAGNPVVLNAPQAPTIANIAKVNPSSCSLNNGSITISASGSGVLEYSINGGLSYQSSNSFYNLAGGTYNVRVRVVGTGNACISSSNNCILTQPTQATIINAISTSTTDCNLNDGTITAFATGGNAPLQYSIDNGSTWQTNNVFVAVAAGSYTIKVRNSDASCEVSTTTPITVNQPQSGTIENATGTPATCGQLNGSITISATGGIAPLQYSINNTTWQTSNIFNNLASGSYTIYIKNANGSCIKQYGNLVNISSNSQPTIISVTPTNITNCNLTDGAITVSATGGNTPLQYSKDGGISWQTANIFNNLVAGTYNVIVRNADNTCPASASPVVITSPASPIILNATSTNPTDCGLNNGTITISASGGITTLEYSINGNSWQTSNVFTNLSSGTYTVYVRNNNSSCVVQGTNTLTITNPVIPTITNVTSSDPTSCGTTDGTISISATPSTGLQYSINNGVTWQTSGQFTNLSAGTYNVSVRYSTGLCTTNSSQNPIVLTAASSVQILSTLVVNPTACSGLMNGSITIYANGGTGVLQYSIDNGATFQLSNYFSNLAAGVYSVIVKDASGTCQKISTATLVAPINPTIPTATTTPTSSCILNDGSISITVPLGTNFEYSINNGATWQNNTTFSNLAAGNYSVIVRTVGTSCTAVSALITVGMPAMPTISSVNSTSTVSSCIINGQIVVNVATTGTWEYSIDGGNTWQSSNTFTNVPQGSYNVMVRNTNSPLCSKPYQGNPVQLTAPQAASIININTTQPTICSGNNGTISISVIGGTAPIQYSINGGTSYQTSNNFTNLATGTYIIKVKDNNGCETLGSNVNIIGINAPTALSASATPITDCNLSNGSITVNSVSGTGPFEYSINNGLSWQTSNIFLNLAPATYTLSVRTVGSSCVFSNPSATVVGQPTSPIINNVNSTLASCGANDGSIIVSGSTGALFSINGINFQTSGIFNNLAPGSYTIYISNSNGTCKTPYSQNPVVITSAQGASITNVTVTNPANCATNPTGTIAISATSGVPPYQYSINGGVSFQSSNIFTNVAAGTYQIVVRGSGTSANCPSTFVPVTINSSSSPQIVNSFVVNPTSCIANGSINVVAQGGIQPLYYSIDGTNWQISNLFSGLATGSYVLYVRNADGSCTQTANAPVILTTPAKPVITNISKVDPSNCTATNGSITITSSPSTNVEYSIDNIHWQASNQFSNIAAGAYTVYIRNTNGSCASSYSNNPVILNGGGSPSIVAVDKTNVSDCSLNNGTITVHVANSNTQHQYSIDNGVTYQLSNYFTDLAVGTYTIKVTNLSGDCPVTQPNVILTAPSLPTITNINSTPTTNCGTNTGSISITATGGVAPLQYSIDNGANWTTTNVFTNLAVGNYAIRIRNAGGSCIVLYPSAVTVGEPQKPTISSVIDTEPTACSVNDGKIVITATAGTGTYEYSINDINWQSSNTFSNLAAGTYSVYVRNAGSNCPVSYTLPISLTPSSAPSITLVNPENPTTCNGNNGKITITAIGGSGNLEYSINNGVTFQSTNIFNNLVSGTYSVVVRNSNGTCPVTYPSTVLIAPSAPSIIVSSPTATTDCNGNDGKITIIASGTDVLEYSIDGINWQTSNIFQYLNAGTYTPSVRILGTSCITTGTSVTVTQPNNAPNVTNVTKVNPTACGANNGSITVNATGGTSPLQYSIDGINWQTLNTFSNLPGGTYYAYVRNANSTCATPSLQNPIIISPSPTAPTITNVATTNVTDCAKTNGSITINATGGTAPLQYSIDGGSTWQTTNTFTNLPAGSYEIVVRNADGTCVVQNTPVKITAPVSPTLFNVLLKNPTDCGLSNGQITVLATGSSNLQYSIDSMKTWSTGNIFTHIGTGTYYVFVRNANGTCAIASPNNPFVACEFDLALRKKLAPGQDSIIRLGKDVDFKITVFNQGVLTATDIEITDYIPKGMILSPNDNNGWSYNPVIPTGTFVNPNNALKVKKTISGPLVSKDSVTLNIKLRAIFGTANTRLVNVAEISSAKDINGVPHQDIDSYADDTKGNDKEKDNIITDKNVVDEDDEDPAPVKLDNYDPHGYIYCDKSGMLIKGGHIQLLTAPAGATIYFVNDANGIPLDGRNGVYQFFTNGVPGTYNFTYIHPSGYQLSTMILPQGGSFNPAGTDGTIIDKDGIFNNIVTLGSEATSDTLINKNPVANPYYLSITLNANETTLISNNNIPVGCACINSVVCQDVNGDGVAQPTEPGVNGVKVIIYNCTTNQKVDSTITANSGKYLLSGLLSGTYKLQFVIPSGYNFVSNGQPVSINAQGFTNCFPLGLNGCEDKPVCIATCPAISISPNVTICAGTSTTIVASGGLTYLWAPATTLNTNTGSSVIATPLNTTTYTVTATNNGCTSTAQVTVTTVTAPSSNFSVNFIKPTSCTTNNGSITIVSTQPNLEFSIDNGQTWQSSNVFNNVAPGSYIAQIRFAGSQCPTAYPSNPVIVTPVSAPTITNVVTVNPNNCDNPNGTITITANGTSGLEYSINGGVNWSANNQFTNLAAGTYNISVRNSDGTCAVSYPTVTLVSNKPIINAVNVVSDCANNNRSITILASGGQPALEYSINGGQNWYTNNVFSNLAAGYYTVMVRNFNGTCPVTYGNQPIALCAFDLAIKKSLIQGQNPIVRLGDIINYQVKVYNQGAIAATNVSVVDYIPKGMQIYPNGSNGWFTVNDSMATNLVVGPIAPGDSVTLNLSMRLVFGSPNTSLKNVVEIKDAKDGNGNSIADIDSTPDMVKNNDIEKDDIINENGKNGGDEDDSDPANITLDNFDPSGYIYCEKTGKILTGGKIKLVSAPQGGDIFFTTDANGTVLDGRTGMYQIFTNGVSGTYTLTYEHPNKYPLSTTCLPLSGAFNPSGNDGNSTYDKDGIVNGIIHLGSLTNNGSLVDKTCSANKYYLSFILESNEKTLIATNNIPVSCGVIQGTICSDTNGDGLPQTNEPGVGGLKVSLFDCKNPNAVAYATTTDVLGKYQFDGLTAGDYQVQITLPSGQTLGGGKFNTNGITNCTPLKFGECIDFSGCVQMCPTINNVLTMKPWCPKENGAIVIDATCQGDLQYSIDGGKTYQKLNAFLNLSAGTYNIIVKNSHCETPYGKVVILECESMGNNGSISGKAFKSCYDDGLKGTNKGFAGIIVTLTSSNGSTLTTTTNANGIYNFAALDAGNYTISFEQKTGFAFVKQNQGTNDANDSDVDITGKTTSISLAANQLIDNVDAGYQDTEGPKITFTHPWLVGKKDGDTIYMDCGSEQLLTAKDAYAIDNSDANPIVKMQEDPAIISKECDKDGYLVKMHCGWVSTDECGNKTQIWLNIIVRDKTDPTLSGVPQNVVISDKDPIPSVANVTADDKCDKNVKVIFAETKNGNVLTRIWTATDACGNKTISNQTITIIPSNNGCSITVLPVPVTYGASCIGKDGKAKLTPTNYTYTWADGFVGDIRLDLDKGTYKVTATDDKGCTAIFDVIIKDNCTTSQLTFNLKNEIRQVACGNPQQGYCLDLDFNEVLLNYQILDNGQPLTTKIEPCSSILLGKYSLHSIINIPLQVQEWDINGQKLSFDFFGFDELVAKLNQYDTNGKWKYDALDEVISNENYVKNYYGNLTIGNDKFGVKWILQPNEITIPHGVKIMVQGIGKHLLSLKHNQAGVQDSVKIQFVCTSPATYELLLEEGTSDIVDIATKELVGTKCIVENHDENPANDIAEFKVNTHNQSIISVSATHQGFKQVMFTMCDENNICDTATVKVIVYEKEIKPAVKDKTIKTYSGFSPNEDGTNDTFVIENIEYYSNTLTIYDRWGNQVYFKENYDNSWKGKFKGNDLPDGTYFYQLSIKGQKNRTGFVQIRR